MADTENPGITLIDAPALTLVDTPVAQAIVRTADAEVIERLGLPAVCSAHTDGEETSTWLGPTEWLVYRSGDGPALVADLESRIGGAAAYVLDVTGQRTRLVLSGPYAATVLAHGCALDLSPGSFGPTGAAQTLLAQAGILLHRTPSGHTPTPSGHGFVIVVRSSYAHYLISWLHDAATEYLATPDLATQNLTTRDLTTPA